MKVLMTYAPVVILADATSSRSAGLFRDFDRDIRKFFTTKGPDKYPTIEVHIPKTISEVRELFAWMLEEAQHVSADFETTGLSVIDSNWLALGYSWVDEDDPYLGTAFVLTEKILNDRNTWKLVGKQLSHDQATVFHNAKFDLKWMKRGLESNGLRYEPWSVEDTMLLNYLLDERPIGRAEAHNLDAIARYRFDAPDYNIEMGKWLKAYAKETDRKVRAKMRREMYKYCAADVYYTDRAYPILYDEVAEESEGLLDVYNKLLIPGTIALADVESVGIRLDVDELQRLKAQLGEREEGMLVKIREHARDFGFEGWENFNPNSSKQMKVLMYDHLKLPPTKTPRRGRLQEGPTSTPVMRILRDKFPQYSPFMGDVMAYRTAKKTIGTYVDGLSKRLSSDGRIRSDLLLNGTETGRLSSRNPNLQNVPEVSHIEIDIRACFITTSEEWLLLEADYSQLELRVAAHLSKDPDWLQVYLEDRDLHQDVAGALYHKPKEEVTPYQRWLAKNTVFGAMYGRGAESLALGPEMDYIEREYGGTRWTLEEAKQYFRNFFDQYKGFKAWIDEQHRVAHVRHFVETPFGRKRRFPFIPRNDNGLVKRQSVNTPIQSTASDITLSALIRIHEQLLLLNEQYGEVVARVILTIHDSVMVECKKKVARKVKKIMLYEMQENVPIDTLVPFKAEIHEADNWSGLK
jgi:DNA polymerase-1